MTYNFRDAFSDLLRRLIMYKKLSEPLFCFIIVMYCQVSL